LVLDTDGNVIARPFPKFFNYGDPQIGEIPIEPYTVTEKLDGSLGIVYRLEGVPHIATRGSFTSDQAIKGTAMLREQELAHFDGITALFEIVYPENRIVVDYGGQTALTLLAAIDNATGLDTALPYYTGPKVQHHGEVSLETLTTHDRPNCEGYVVAFQSGLRVKVKHAEYVRLHKIVTGINARFVWESMRAGDDLTTLLTGIPDEIYQWVDNTRRQIQFDYDELEAAALTVFTQRPLDVERKEIAAYFLGSSASPSVMFSMLDGKDYADIIWKAIRPEALTPTYGDIA
jgi:RNA ligase